MPNFTRLSGNCAATLNQLCSLLEEDEVLTEESEEYKANSQPWAAQKDQKPPLVIRPTSVKSLSTVVARLYSSDIDFAIRGHGFSSASAKDVIVSMTAFDDFEFDTKEEWAVVGAGQTWSEVYDKMEKVAPDFALVGARTPAISVGGTVMNGGYSWLSREYGCISDPVNMLDAEIVKGDGTVAWASSEPDLLWALRGGGGGFCGE
ncbi:hypothetical protein N7535_008733 [Penicillium sp. DV-2018c]|nr:hypothetical protein N7461_002490 [Penicillium sp. DV-2018c]KAJ5563569.1 hypothetical protein N7535_008733 [Penicillium sp. DV-2018c]